MKTLLTTLNAKYIHTSLALRLLYSTNYSTFDIDFKEYVIKDDLKVITDDIIAQDYDVIGISTYIWNVELVKELCLNLKAANENIIIILGGPEVSYEPEYFINNFNIDYVVSGEGEEVLSKLLQAIEENDTKYIPGVSSKHIISKHVLQSDLSTIQNNHSPYQLAKDKKDFSNRIVYFESARGCPHQCAYCLSSLEKGMRFFDEDYVFSNLKYLIDNNVKTIKFLDRSFNANVDYALKILTFIIENHKPGQSFQFEVNADVMNTKIIDFVGQNAPRDLIRFEVGIQSTYNKTNLEINRYQDFSKLSSNINKMLSHQNITLHLDLIAGLPYEDLTRLSKSFDDVFAFRAPELQLGFLKMLRGTSLKDNADKYGYKYQDHAPYEMISNNWLSSSDVAKIHLVEEMLEKYWNSGYFKKSLPKILNLFDSSFDFFLKLGEFYVDHNYSFSNYQLNDLFSRLEDFLKINDIDLTGILKYDYYNYFKIKPKRFTNDLLTIEQKKIINKTILNDNEFLATNNLNQELLYRYGLLEIKDDKTVYIIIYKNNSVRIIEYLINSSLY